MNKEEQIIKVSELSNQDLLDAYRECVEVIHYHPFGEEPFTYDYDILEVELLKRMK